MKILKLKAEMRDVHLFIRQGLCLLAFLFGYLFTHAQSPCPTIIDYPISGTATFEGCEYAYASSIITASANVEVKACEQIKLLPGFKANSGSHFHAYINECNTTPDPCVIPPVCSAKDATVQIDQECKALITLEDIDDGSYGICSPLSSLEVFPSFFNCDDAENGEAQVTLTVVDSDGNATSCNANVTILPPDPLIAVTFNPPVPFPNDINCNDPIPPFPDVTAVNACGDAVELNQFGPFFDPDPDPCENSPIEYVYVPRGVCNQKPVAVLTIFRLADTNPPTFDSNPSPIATIPCDGYKPPQETLTATDDCDSNAYVLMNRVEDGDLCEGITVTDSWLAIDECDNINLETLIWYIEADTEAPTFLNGPNPIDDIYCCDELPEQETLYAEDNCDPNVEVTASVDDYYIDCAGPSPITYRWTATDTCGNTRDTSITFYVLPDDCGSGSGAHSRSMTDDHGTTQWLKIIPNAVSISIQPNPSNGDFVLMVDSPESNEMNIQLYSMTGQKVYNDSFYVIKGKYQKSISLPKDLLDSIYILRAQIGKEEFTERVIISK